MAVSICFASAGDIAVEQLVVVGGSTDTEYLQYDDGIPAWYAWGGVYRGVWFNTDDFLPSASGFLLDYSEFWVSGGGFYAQVWNGGPSGPEELLDSQFVDPAEYTRGLVYYVPPLETKANFWIIENTEPSPGGWPMLMGDGTPPAVDHSFFSDDFFTWEPWSDGSTTGDYLIRAGGNFSTAIANSTWGGIKATF